MIVSTVPECKLLMHGKSESEYLSTVSAPMKANQFILAKVSSEWKKKEFFQFKACAKTYSKKVYNEKTVNFDRFVF